MALAKNLITLDQLNETDLFLGKRRPTKNWEPCRILSIVPKINSAGYNVIFFQFLDGKQVHAFVSPNNHVYGMFGDAILKKMPKNYIQDEIQKHQEIIRESQKKIEMLLQNTIQK